MSLYLDVLDELQKGVNDFLKERDQRSIRLDGSVSNDKRFPLQEEFQNDPDAVVWLGQAKASGVGLTLTAATYMIHNDMWWNPAMVDQATDRIYRIGQEKAVMVYYMLAAGTFADKLYGMISAKRQNVKTFEAAAENTEAAVIGLDGGAEAENVMAAIYKDLLKQARQLERTAKKAAKKGKS
jgi:SNF2 family DNA or RNA helicase